MNSKTPGPLELAADYMDCLRRGDTQRMSGFFHPDTLTEYRDLICDILCAEAEEGESVVLVKFFGEGVTLPEALAASPAFVFECFMSALGAMGALMETPKILGGIAEGDSLHVLARLTATAGEFQQTTMEVLSFRHDGQGWWLELSGQLQGLAGILKGRFATDDAH